MTRPDEARAGALRYEIRRVGGAPIGFGAFADQHGLKLVVHERPGWIGGVPRYYAIFDYCDVKEGPCLVGKFGNGGTPEEAVLDYAKEIAGERLVFRSGHDDRREIQCPNEWEPEPLKAIRP